MMKPVHVERLYRDLAKTDADFSHDRRQTFTTELQQMNAGRLTNALRKAIAKSDRTQAAIAWDAGMNPSQMYRFMAGGTITLETADSLAELLVLDLTPATTAAKKGKPARVGR